MEKNTSEDTEKANNVDIGTKQQLTVSDWVTFLSSEKQGNLSYFLGFAAFLITVIAIIYALPLNTWAQPMFLGVLLAWGYFKAFRPIQRRYDRAHQVLTKIMRGGLREGEDIRKEWEREELPNQHRGKHWQVGGSAYLAFAFWLAGWLFTVAYANLVWWKMILALAAWPYYLGLAIR